MKFLIALFSLTMLQIPAFADIAAADGADQIQEINPFDPGIEDALDEFDRIYEEETGESAWLPSSGFKAASSCTRRSCKVWIVISKSAQQAQLYVDGIYRDGWPVSTGMAGFETPNFDRHPNGRVYTRYTSTKYPEGDYAGLGNMPYAVFIEGGFALHGTPKGNWSRLGRPASHGCIRMHPDKARYFNNLVRSVGIRNVWITVY